MELNTQGGTKVSNFRAWDHMGELSESRAGHTLKNSISLFLGIPIDLLTVGSLRYLMSSPWYAVVKMVSSKNNPKAKQIHTSLARAALVARGRVMIR